MTVIYDVLTGADSSAAMGTGTGVVRYGIELNGAGGLLVGKNISTLTVSLLKGASPSGNITATVRNSADTVRATFQESIAATSLTTSFAPYTFTLSSPITLANGDKILVEYGGPASITIEVWSTDHFDTSVTRRTRFTTSYAISNTSDIVARITDGTFISQTYTHKYNIRKLITQTYTHLYKIRKLISQSYTHLYKIRKLISQSYTHLYKIRQLATQTFTHKYNIKQLATQVFTHKYNIRQLATKTFTHLYKIKQLASQSYIHKYKIRQLATQTFTHIYNILEITTVAVNQIYTQKYKIRKLVSQSYTHKYNIVGRISQIFTHQYNIKKLVNQSYTHKYRILTLVFQTFVQKYKIVGRISRTFSFLYRITGQPPTIPLDRVEGRGPTNLRVFHPDPEIDRVPEPERPLETPPTTSEIRGGRRVPRGSDDLDLL